MNINLKRYLLKWIEHFNQIEHKFHHNFELNFTTINDKMNITYGHYIKQTMQAIESKLNMIIAQVHN